MTLGPAAGFPDWQGYAQWGSTLIAAANQTAGARTIRTLYKQSLPQWSAVRIQAVGVTAVGTLRINVGNSSGLTAPLASYTYAIAAGSPSLDVTIPTMGGVVQVQMDDTAGASDWTIQFAMTGLNVHVERPAYNAPLNAVAATGSTIAAGANLDLQLPWIAAGRVIANINVLGTGSISDIELQTMSAGATAQWNILAVLATAANGVHFYDLALPPQPFRLHLVNSGTVSVTSVYASLWTDTD